MKAIVNVCQSHQHSDVNGYTFDVSDFNNRSLVLDCWGKNISFGFSEIIIVDLDKEITMADNNLFSVLKGYSIVNNIKLKY